MLLKPRELSFGSSRPIPVKKSRGAEKNRSFILVSDDDNSQLKFYTLLPISRAQYNAAASQTWMDHFQVSIFSLFPARSQNEVERCVPHQQRPCDTLTIAWVDEAAAVKVEKENK